MVSKQAIVRRAAELARSWINGDYKIVYEEVLHSPDGFALANAIKRFFIDMEHKDDAVEFSHGFLLYVLAEYHKLAGLE